MCPAAADSNAFRFAVYDTYDKAHPPETRPPDKRTGGYLLDKHAALARDCWVYPIVSVFPSEENTHIPYELKIDPAGAVLRPVGKPNLHLPIKSRPSAFSIDPDHPFGAKFSEKIDAEGRPLIVRLFFSPFRLGKIAIEQLCTPKYEEGRRIHLPYLWEWTTEKTDSPLKTKTGLYLKESRTYLSVTHDDGSTTRERVWVGFEPFRNARRRSDAFVAAWTEYASTLEANTKNIDEWHKNNFVEMLHDTIYNNKKIPRKYVEALDHKKLTTAYDAFNKPRTASRQQVAEKAKRLSHMLLHPFFSLLQFASFQPVDAGQHSKAQGSDKPEVDSEALVSHIHTLAFVTRNLVDHPAGAAVVNQWIAESARAPHHFINQVIFPDQPVAEDILKTVRLQAKGTFSAASQIFARVIAQRNKTAKDVARALFHVGIFESADDALKALKEHTLSLEDFYDSLRLVPEGREFAKVDLIKVEHGHQIQAWLEKDMDSSLPVLQSATATRKAAFLFLDGVNVALSYRAFRDATTEAQRVKAGLSTSAGTILLAVSLTEFWLDKNDKAWRAAPESTRMWKVLTVAKGAAAIIYGVTDVLDALDAFKKGEKTRGNALLLAAAAEGVTAGIYMVQALAGGPLFGGLLAAAAVIAAISYTVALHAVIDPLEHFLQNCEYGTTPYKDGKYHQRWTGTQISEWKGDVRTQTRAFIRALTRFAMSWKRTAENPAMLRVMIECRRRTPDTRITVTFVAEFPEGKNQSRRVFLHHEDLPSSDTPVAVDSPIDFIARGASRVTVHAQIELRVEGYDDQLAAVLWVSPASGRPKVPDIHRVAIAD